MDLSKSIEELENKVLGKPDFDSHLVVECYRLCKVPLSELTVENLRMLIGQQIGLIYLVPLALEILVKDPFVEGDFYKGDLLKNVSELPSEFWVNNPVLNNEFTGIAKEAIHVADTLNNVLLP